MTAAQSSHDREKAEIQAMLQEDKEECLRDEKDKFQGRLAQMKALNTDLSHKMMTLQDENKRVEDDLEKSREEF